jgi:RNA polymerase sigma-70 factor (ECF subfamily)
MDGSKICGWKESNQVALSDIDRRLLQRCLAREPRAWQEFVDRFVGLVLHVIDHTAHARSLALPVEDREDLVAEVFLVLLQDDFHVLRLFRGESSLATYLTVVARRVIARELARRHSSPTLESVRQQARGEHAPRRQAAPAADRHPVDSHSPEQRVSEQRTSEKRIQDQDEIERMMSRLNGAEAEVVRLYHLEGKTYQEISDHVGMPENSIGPTLSRARTKMREARADSSRS